MQREGMVRQKVFTFFQLTGTTVISAVLWTGAWRKVSENSGVVSFSHLLGQASVEGWQDGFLPLFPEVLSGKMAGKRLCPLTGH